MKSEKKSLIAFKGKPNHSGIAEFKKSTVHIIVEIIEYVPNAVVSKTIIKKTTGNITVFSFAVGEGYNIMRPVYAAGTVANYGGRTTINRLQLNRSLCGGPISIRRFAVKDITFYNVQDLWAPRHDHRQLKPTDTSLVTVFSVLVDHEDKA